VVVLDGAALLVWINLLYREGFTEQTRILLDAHSGQVVATWHYECFCSTEPPRQMGSLLPAGESRSPTARA
jgi:hypothetical protein